MPASFFPPARVNREHHVNATIPKSGLTTDNREDNIRIVEKNAVTVEVADKEPDIANVIIEYNHYLLRGNIERKKELLKHMADALDPLRSKLEGLQKRNTNDFFRMVNKMNIRHNNCDPKDAKNYNAKFDELSRIHKETWFDLIYEQGLALYVLLEQQEENKKIADFFE